MEWWGEFAAWLSAHPALAQGVAVTLVALVGFSVALAFTSWLSESQDPVDERVKRLTQEETNASAPDTLFLVERVIGELGRGLTPKDERKVNRVARKLIQAGYRGPLAVRIFFAAKVIGMVTLPLVVFAVFWFWMPKHLDEVLSYVLFAMPLGFILPDYWLARTLRLRQTRLRQGLPDVLDMLVVCSEAGLGLFASIDRVADEIEVQHPELAAELQLVMRQRSAGMDSAAALRELSERCGIEEVKGLVTTLIQAMRFGTSIADSLRVYSDDFRDARLQAAQEKAGQLEVKMLLPIVFCIMPAFLLVAVGPSLISLTKGLSGN